GARPHRHSPPGASPVPVDWSWRALYNHRVAHAVPDALGRISRGLAAALRARRGVFALAAATVFVLDIAVPPIVLSLAKKPADYFTVNPWLVRLPGYLVAGDAPLGERLGKTWNLALFWFSADNPYGVEWGFAVTVGDLARFLSMAALIGAYFALWAYQRDGGGAATWASRAGAPGGVLGACSSVLGLATGRCTVMRCGPPLRPGLGAVAAGAPEHALQPPPLPPAWAPPRRARGPARRRRLSRVARRRAARLDAGPP